MATRNKTRLCVLPIDLMGPVGGRPLYEPADVELHDLVVKWRQENISEPESIANFARYIAVVEVNEAIPFGQKGRYVACHGCSGYVNRPDIVEFRSAGKKARVATKMLHDAYQQFFAMNGLRGAEVLIHFDPSEAPEARCPNADASAAILKLKPANRSLVTVK